MQRTTKLLGYLEYKVHQWTKLAVGYIHEYRKRPTFMDVFKAFKGFGGVSITHVQTTHYRNSFFHLYSSIFNRLSFISNCTCITTRKATSLNIHIMQSCNINDCLSATMLRWNFLICWRKMLKRKYTFHLWSNLQSNKKTLPNSHQINTVTTSILLLSHTRMDCMPPLEG